MISHNAIYTAIKKILDEDSTLTGLLNKSSAVSSVILGPEISSTNIWPMIQVVITTNEMDISTERSELTFRINVYTNAQIDESFDAVLSESLIQRITALIHNTRPTIIGFVAGSVMAVEGRDPEALPDFGSKNVYFEGLSCRMFAA